MNKEMLNILDDLSKKPTTDLALNVMELTSDNMVKDKEIERLNNIIDELEDFITDKRNSNMNAYEFAYIILGKIQELKEKE